MIGPVPYQVLPNKTHLSEGELNIWQRFVAKFPERFTTVCYDVELGTPRGFDPEMPLNYQKHHKYVGGYKIDVLGEKDGVKTIIEIKKQATTKALGEIWLYEFLYTGTVDKEADVKVMILTDEEMPHMREVCESDDVELVMV